MKDLVGVAVQSGDCVAVIDSGVYGFVLRAAGMLVVCLFVKAGGKFTEFSLPRAELAMIKPREDQVAT
jgi:hypothetical protein